MAAATVSLRYLIMGLLAQQPMSGYDIQRFLKSLGWLIGRPSPGSLYPILRALPAEGLATVETFPGLDRPPRKVYSLTEAGGRELQAWVAGGGVSEAPLKAFVMRLLLAGSFSASGLLAQMQHRRAQVSAQYEALCQMSGNLQEGPRSGYRLAMDYGLAMATAELSWLDSTLGELAKQPLPLEDE